MAEEADSLLSFPCAFPLKVMGVREEGFAQAMLEIVLRHAPDFDASAMQMRPSSGARYLALTFNLTAHSRAQLDALYREISAHPQVKVVL